MARSLAAHHKSLAPAWRPRKDLIDTILPLLAEIFASQAGKTGDHYLLPHSKDSHFIRFSSEALRPFFDPTEISALALKRRWKGLKDERKGKRTTSDDTGPATDDA